MSFMSFKHSAPLLCHMKTKPISLAVDTLPIATSEDKSLELMPF